MAASNAPAKQNLYSIFISRLPWLRLDDQALIPTLLLFNSFGYRFILIIPSFIVILTIPLRHWIEVLPVAKKSKSRRLFDRVASANISTVYS